MKKSISFLFGLFLGITNIIAQGFPTISTNENTKWYLIQFMNGGNAITAESAEAQITTATATGSDAQLWKITGDATNGYTFTNKKGIFAGKTVGSFFVSSKFGTKSTVSFLMSLTISSAIGDIFASV